MAQVFSPSSVSSLSDAFKPDFRAQRPRLWSDSDRLKQGYQVKTRYAFLTSESYTRLASTQGNLSWGLLGTLHRTHSIAGKIAPKAGESPTQTYSSLGVLGGGVISTRQETTGAHSVYFVCYDAQTQQVRWH